jgi:hypothetical protein
MLDRSSQRLLARRAVLSSSFSALRGSLLAVLGLTVTACGGSTDQGSGAAGGSAGSATGGSATGGSATGGSGGSATGGSATGGSGGSATGGSAGSSSAVCSGATPILQPNGADSGYVKCSDGSINRVAAATCAVVLKDTCKGDEMFFECKTGADCVAQPNGSCLTFSTDTTGCSCHYQCKGDSECGPGQACVCAGVGDPEKSFCTSAAGDCAKPGDCPSGECGYATFDDGCSTHHYLYCRDQADICRVDGQCAANEQCAKVDPASNWVCNTPNCVIGRPLLVEESVRVAPATARADWADAALMPELAGLTAELRAALAAHFTAMAALEHASIGSFARFSLELLALGAPPDLLLASQEAAADEVVHARLSYALASAYAGGPVGPGALCVTGVVPSSDAEAIVRALVREACVGETIAAAEASALAALVTDPALQGAFARIAEDEARHAELGYRTLSWLLRRNPELASIARAAFESAMESISPEPLVATAVTSPEHGLLSRAALGALREKARVEIVLPCSRALLHMAGPAGVTPRESASIRAAELAGGLA